MCGSMLNVGAGTRQVLIHSVNKGLGQMARIDASVVTSDLALTAITSSWACNAFSATPVRRSSHLNLITDNTAGTTVTGVVPRLFLLHTHA